MTMMLQQRVVDAPVLDEPVDQPVDWAQIGSALWRYKSRLVVCPLLAAAVAYTATRFMPREYDASALVMVTSSKLGENRESAAAYVPVASVMIRNRGIAADTIAQEKLDQPPHRFTPDGLLGRLVVDEMPQAGVLRLTLRMPTPELAAATVNRFADLAVKASQRFAEDEAVAAERALKTELDRAEGRFKRAQEQLLQYRTQAQVELARSDADTLVTQRGWLARLHIQIAALRKELSQAEAELAKVSKVRETPSVLAALPNAPDAPINLRRDGTGSSFINPVYESLEWQVTQSRTRLAALEQEQRELVEKLKIGRSELHPLSELYEKEATIARLQTDFDIARTVYTDIAARHEQARVHLASQSAAVQVLDRATAPTAAVSPRVRLIVATAFGLTLVLLAGAIIVADRWRGLEGLSR